MTGITVTFFSRNLYNFRPILGLNGRFSSISYGTAASLHNVSQENIKEQSTRFLESSMKKKRMSFQEFKQKEVESFEDYANSSAIQELFKGDKEKAKKAYETFCKSEYYEYERSIIGGNPNQIT